MEVKCRLINIKQPNQLVKFKIGTLNVETMKGWASEVTETVARKREAAQKKTYSPNASNPR